MLGCFLINLDSFWLCVIILREFIYYGVYMQDIKCLLDKVSSTIKKEKENEKSKPGKMSLLSMFRHSHENSHSDVLRYLIDPNEGHKHGDEYLRLFLKNVGLEKLLIHDDLSKCKVVREWGRIDLSIQHKEFYIILENKIWAKDQHSQLERYYKLVTTDREKDPSKVYIIYLTLWGYEASDYSKGEFKDTVFPEMQINKKYLNISYQKHILSWLKQLTFKDNEELLKSAVIQYRYNIEILTNQTEGESNMIDGIKEELREIIKSKPEMWETLYYLEQARTSMIADKLQSFQTKIEGSGIWNHCCYTDHETVLDTFAIDLFCNAMDLSVSITNRNKKRNIDEKVLAQWLQDNGIQDMSYNLDLERVVKIFTHSEENDAVELVKKLNELFKNKDKVKELKDKFDEKCTKLIEVYEALKAKKYSNIVYTCGQEQINKKDVTDYIDIGDYNNIGVGISIIPDMLTVAFETEDDDYNFGLMAHEKQQTNIFEALKECGVEMSESDDECWYNSQTVDASIGVEDMVSKLLKLYEIVKDIKNKFKE